MKQRFALFILLTFLSLALIVPWRIFTTGSGLGVRNQPLGTLQLIANPAYRLMAVGDLNFAGIESFLLNDPHYPWIGTKKVLSTATILIGNQEVPFSNRGQVYVKKRWSLRADPRTAASLTTAGFDLVTLANNHIMDYGVSALEDTLFILNQNSIAHAGAGLNLAAARKPAVLKTPDGQRIAFLAYSQTFPAEFWAQVNRPGTANADSQILAADIRNAKTQADMVVVSFHWGEELLNYPKPYQKKFAHECIDAGASIVIGHHPHVLQGMEVYRGGLIAYSLGNFLFGSYSAKSTDSAILAVDFDRNGLIQAQVYPVNVNNREVSFQTKLRHGADAQRVLADLRTFSAEFTTRIKTVGDTGIIPISR